MKLKLVTLISFFAISSTILAQETDLTVNTACGLNNASGTYSFIGIHQGKPHYIKDEDCPSYTNDRDCDAVYGGPYEIR